MTILCYDDAREAARRRLPHAVFDFIDGGAGAEVTLRANRAAFERLRFHPRWLVDVSQRETSVVVLGERLSMPVIMAPTGLARLSHRDGELAAARAAGAQGTVFCVSTSSSCSLEEVADVAPGSLWFQLYLWRDLEGVELLVRRAATAGYKALVLTIDVPVVGNRERDLRNRASIPPKITLRNALDVCRRPRWAYDYVRGDKMGFGNLRGDAYPAGGLGDTSATWERFDWLRRIWDGPLVVKGILSADDALEATQRGADAVYVSNHGGRQLDSSPGTVDVATEIVDAVNGRAAILLDGGVRRGEDVVKACALGVQACLIGRPWVFALAADGQRGVEAILQNLQVDIARTLALVGVPNIGKLSRDALR